MYDLCVIGGGIYGCGVAQAAAANGLSALLVEKGELASGTSSQSTKLIHGGLRYLEQGRLKLVYEALAEREILLRIAPGLVERVWVHIPIYAGSRRSRAWVGAGLALYWLLSAGRSPMRGFTPERSPVPALRREGLRWVWAYTDASTDDARLVRAVADSARRFGCEIRTHCALERAEAHEGRWKIALGDGSRVEARVLVNAAGAWIPAVARRIVPAPPSPPVRLVQGSHLWLDRPMGVFVYLESLDGRVMFVRPWRGRTLVGTTETEFSGDPDRRAPTPAEIEAMLATFNHYFPELACTERDILGTYCGIRVLPHTKGSAFRAPRSTWIVERAEPAPYLVLYGGKLTTYRRWGMRVLRRIRRYVPFAGWVDTRTIPL